MVYNGYYKVMSNILKMGHLPTPGKHKPYIFFGVSENRDTPNFVAWEYDD